MGELFDSKGKSSKSYSEVAECLFAEIREGKYSAGNSFPSLTRIASRFGIDTGDVTYSTEELGDTEIYGTPRILNGQIDIGAGEKTVRSEADIEKGVFLRWDALHPMQGAMAVPQ